MDGSKYGCINSGGIRIVHWLITHPRLCGVEGELGEIIGINGIERAQTKVERPVIHMGVLRICSGH